MTSITHLGYREVAPGDLADFPGNATIHDEEALDASVGRFGQFQALLARELPDGTLQLLAGHGTRAALVRNEVTSTRVEVIQVDDETALGINLAANGTTRRRDYEPAALLDLLAQARAAGGLGGTGWDDAEHDRLLALVEAPAPAPEPQPPAEFPSYDDETIETSFKCPSCGYQWSGNPGSSTDE